MDMQKRAFTLVAMLAEARTVHADCARILAEAKHETAMIKALVEQRIIEDAGGIKVLGANETERSRKLFTGLDNSRNYTMSLKALRQAEYDKAIAGAKVQALREELDVILTFVKDGNND